MAWAVWQQIISPTFRLIPHIHTTVFSPWSRFLFLCAVKCQIDICTVTSDAISLFHQHRVNIYMFYTLMYLFCFSMHNFITKLIFFVLRKQFFSWHMFICRWRNSEKLYRHVKHITANHPLLFLDARKIGHPAVVFVWLYENVSFTC